MVRYLGPRLHILKRLGIPFLLGFSSKYNFSISKNKKIIGNLSEFSKRLFEKQKLKYYYGFTEKKLKLYVTILKCNQSIKNFGLLCLIEKRLDVTLFRIGFSISIRQARQFITHEHIFVNKYCIKTPTFTPKIGDIIYIKSNSTINTLIKKNLKLNFKINQILVFDINLIEKNLLPQTLVCVFSLKALIIRPIYPRDILLNINNLLILESYF